MTDSTTESTSVTRADFWLDPVCPWAWMTSRWMLEVEKVRPIQVYWHQMSLSYLNKDRDLPEDYARSMQQAWLPSRVMMAAQQWVRAQTLQEGKSEQQAQQAAQQLLAQLYTEFGQRFHVDGRSEEHEKVMVEALAAAGCPEELLTVGHTTEVDEQVAASHHAGMDAVGQEVGTPIIHVGGVAFFGPVVSPAPTGQAAGQLWDGVVLVAGVDGFFELKRSRTRGPVF